MESVPSGESNSNEPLVPNEPVTPTHEGGPQANKERVQTILAKFDAAKSMPAGDERDAYIQEQYDALAKIVTPNINRSMNMGNKKIWQFIAEGEDFDLVANVVSSNDSIQVNVVMD